MLLNNFVKLEHLDQNMRAWNMNPLELIKLEKSVDVLVRLGHIVMDSKPNFFPYILEKVKNIFSK